MEITALDYTIGVVIAGAGSYLLLSLLGIDGERMMLFVEFYKAIRVNADKERRIAQTTSEGPKRFIKMERKAQRLLLREGLLEFVPPAPPATPPAPAPAKAEAPPATPPRPAA